MVAHNHGQLWNASQISSSLGVSAPTVRRYLDLLCDTFVVRQLTSYHPNVKKRLVKSPKVYLRDSGLVHALLRIDSKEALLGTPYAGASYEGWVIEQIRAMIDSSWSIHFYRTSAGAEVDVVLLHPGRPPVAVEVKLTRQPKLSRGLRLSMNDMGCRRGFVVCPIEEPYPLSGNITATPITALEKLVGSD
jgi:predicted AAA+ superfamily ATPase